MQVINGEPSALNSEHAPFDLLFADGAGYGSDAARLRTLFPLLTIGGTIVVDDVTPLDALSEDNPFRRHDDKREAFASDSTLWSLEVVAPDLLNSALVGTRVQ